MTRFIFPLVLALAAVLSFFYLTKPMYERIQTLKADKVTYQDAVDKSTNLVAEYDALVAKYDAVTPADMERLSKLLPDSPDNIKLTLEMERLAAKHSMALTNVKFDPLDKQNQSQTAGAKANAPVYTTFNTTFTTQSTYPNFVAFMDELEKSLRVVDFKTINFATSDTNTIGVMKFDVSITTYYLKD